MSMVVSVRRIPDYVEFLFFAVVRGTPTLFYVYSIILVRVRSSGESMILMSAQE